MATKQGTCLARESGMGPGRRAGFAMFRSSRSGRRRQPGGAVLFSLGQAFSLFWRKKRENAERDPSQRVPANTKIHHVGGIDGSHSSPPMPAG